MENNGMIINNDPNTKELVIRMKPQIDAKTLYSCIVTIIEWAMTRHNTDGQAVLNALKEKNFIQEHFYNPAVVE